MPAGCLGTRSERACWQQYAILVEESPVHCITSVNILGDSLLHKIPGRNNLDLPRGKTIRIDDATYATEVVAMRMRVNHRRHRQVLDFLVDQFESRARGFPRCKRIEDDPAFVASHKSYVGEVEAAYLVDAIADFI